MMAAVESVGLWFPTMS